MYRGCNKWQSGMLKVCTRKRLWDKKTRIMAATNGHLNILMYAHENGCPWNECITFWDTISGNLNFLIYARCVQTLRRLNSMTSHYNIQNIL